jgi:sugar lactone lactonase YvrE
VVFADGLGFMEDLTFDGQGTFVITGDTRNNALEKIDGSANVTTMSIESSINGTAGFRYMPDGRLMVARPSLGEVTQIFSGGEVRRYIDGLMFPNGVYPDFTGTLWVSDSDADEVVRVTPEREVDVVASGEIAQGANGVLYDERRQSLFYATGMYLDYMRIVRIDFDDSGVGSDPVKVIELDDANGDGVAMDGCGNIYFADNHTPAGTSTEEKTTKIRRLRLDAKGDLIDSEIIAEVPGSVTSFQWGSGPGFDPESLYTVGFRGVSNRIEVGVIGAPVPIPDFSQEPAIP